MRENTILGCFFLSLAAFLYVSKHFTAAFITIHMLNSEPGPISYYEYTYANIGNGFSFWIFLSFLMGIFFLVRSKKEFFQQKLFRRNGNKAMDHKEQSIDGSQ
ncbi:hypothetical protein [Alkalihalobacterium chitinilyticum]|uniref:Uncharacterized protein n=1 Tax=Alkalihalobacterium chitinilyticum TaxID=2980103 RepID=A0ABT5VCQ7_9BACI|nr:hypothetical protein [Alkalihalobacterium chitinilyticum]MDE5413228.1 hypothetical protein [Alkalihalobacterium chitinilyticum]